MRQVAAMLTSTNMKFSIRKQRQEFNGGFGLVRIPAGAQGNSFRDRMRNEIMALLGDIIEPGVRASADAESLRLLCVLRARKLELHEQSLGSTSVGGHKFQLPSKWIADEQKLLHRYRESGFDY
jgi:hypothetical protein